MNVTLLALLALVAVQQDAPNPPSQPNPLETMLAESGVQLDVASGLVAVEARVAVRDELLEYLCSGPGGAAHESLVVTEVQPSLINTALLTLGVRAGTNAIWTPRDPPPTREERRKGVPAYDVTPPEGDGFLIYAAWREGEETYLFRIEDLLVNLFDDRHMPRHRWVYLGSQFIVRGEEGEPVERKPGDPPREEVFAADVEQNLINISFFHEGHTLLTASLPECVEQTIWMGNPWLLPPRDAALWLVFAREPIRALPPRWAERLPRTAEADPQEAAPPMEGEGD